ncbi:MAG: Trm112 family protein [Myxococcaceae bacterium]|nr:Trm112 family protein [Myxococcaceae bacterium]
MPIHPTLLEVLACPEDKGPLLYFQAEGLLYNPRRRRKYRVEDDLPIMLVEESTLASEQEHAALEAKARAEHVALNFTP